MEGFNVKSDAVINVYFDAVDIFTVTVNYLDEEGNVLHDPYVAEITENTSYNVSGLDDEVEIDGYEYKETLGDELISDFIDGNKVIDVIYTKVEEPEMEIPEDEETEEVNVYTLIIEYLDAETNKPIGAPYFEGIIEGGSYDVSHLDDEIKFDGYVFNSVSGDVVGENVDGNIRIVVLYDKVVEPTPEPQPDSEVPAEPQQPQEPEVQPEPQPETKPQIPAQPQPEEPKGEVEFDVPQTGLDMSLYMSIATGLAATGFVVRRKRK